MQNFLSARARTLGLVTFGVVLCSVNVAAVTVACSGSTPYSSVQALGATGCYEVDKTFSDFAASTNTFSTNPYAMNAIFLDASSSGYSSSALYTVDTQFFNDKTGGAFSSRSNSGDFTELVNSNNAGGTDGAYPSGAIPNIITSVGLNATATTGNKSGDAITVEEIFCTGTSACGSNFVTLTVAFNGSGVSTPTTTSCVITGAVSGVVCGSGASATISRTVQAMNLNVETAFFLTGPGTGTADTLNSFTFTYGEVLDTPEPSTFGLLGASLAALALGMWSQRKSA